MTQLAGSMANGEVVNVELLGSIELKSLSEVVIEDKLRKLAPEQAVAQNEPVQRQKAPCSRRERSICRSPGFEIPFYLIEDLEIHVQPILPRLHDCAS